MAYLLDTHIVIWLANEPQKLLENVKFILSQKQEVVYFSSVNLWEIAIKSKLKKTGFDVNIYKLYQYLLKNHYRELPVLAQHCLVLNELPLIHDDPFDRILVAQAIAENLTLITHDGNILKYQGLKMLKA